LGTVAPSAANSAALTKDEVDAIEVEEEVEDKTFV